MLNQQIGQYRIISKLGEGGMANVYLAEKGSLGKQVALKVLKEDFLSNREVRKRFLDEPKKMIKLNHPNIVGVHDLINNTDFVAIELDYIEGKTLQQHLRTKGALPDNEIEHLLKQMLDAIGYAHKKGFVHRDIKPSNLMLTENGIIKLTDFGIAKDMDYTGADTTTGIQMGTPKYMSPEQVLSSKSVDYRSDIYSLGVVLWEMVTGRVPYDIDKDSVHETPTKVVKEKLAVTNTKWDVVIQKATQKEAEDRYADVERIVLKEKSPRPEDNNDDTLKQYIQKIGALSDDEIQDLFMQMLKLVGELHEKDIVYGKINPSNFLLSHNGIIKLKDYNLIKDRDDPFITYSKPDEGRQKENLMYLSPEQLRSGEAVDHRTDFYSLGAVLWEMVTGKVPYHNATKNPFDITRKIIKDPLENTDTKWDLIIVRSTWKLVGERYDNIQEILVAVKHLKDSLEFPYEDDNKQKKKSDHLIIIIPMILIFLYLAYMIYEKFS